MTTEEEWVVEEEVLEDNLSHYSILAKGRFYRGRVRIHNDEELAICLATYQALNPDVDWENFTYENLKEFVHAMYFGVIIDG